MKAEVEAFSNPNIFKRDRILDTNHKKRNGQLSWYFEVIPETESRSFWVSAHFNMQGEKAIASMLMANLRRAPGALFTLYLFLFVCALTISILFCLIGALSKTLAQAMAPAAVSILISLSIRGLRFPSEVSSEACARFLRS